MLSLAFALLFWPPGPLDGPSAVSSSAACPADASTYCGVITAVEESSDFPLREFFLSEDLSERPEEREESQDLKVFGADSALQLAALAIYRHGSHSFECCAWSHDASIPTRRSVLRRC
jgi:hypothetical protein